MGTIVFHQGYAADGQLWYWGDETGPDTQVPNVGMSASPSAVVFRGGIYVFHQGESDNGQLWYSYFDGTNWQPDTQVPNVGMSGSPSAVVFGGGIYVFHQGVSEDGNIWYSYFDGTNWQPDTQIPNVRIGGHPDRIAAPSAVAFPGGISVFHQGRRDDPRDTGGNSLLYYTSFDGTNWQPDTQVLGFGIACSPSAVVLNPAGAVSVFHQGVDDTYASPNGTLWYSYFDGTNWQSDTQVQNVGIFDSPSAVAWRGGPGPGGISVFHQGTMAGLDGPSDGQLWYSFYVFDGSAWQADTLVTNVRMTGSPSAVVFPISQGTQHYSWGNDNIVTINGVSGRLLTQGSALYSVNNPGNALYKYASGESGPYYQAIVQTDGNFAVYYFDANGQRTPKFWTNTGGKVNDSNWTLAVQTDGNLVLYHTDSSGNINSGAYWASNTWQINKPAPGFFGLSMQQDGNLVLYLFYNDGTCDPVWATSNNAPTGTIVWNH